METVFLSFLLEKIFNIALLWENKKEQRKELYLFLQSATRKFIIDWEQVSEHYAHTVIYEKKLKMLQMIYRQQILELIVPASKLIAPKIYDKFLELTKQMCIAESSIKENARVEGDKAKKIAEELINLIQKQIDKK